MWTFIKVNYKEYHLNSKLSVCQAKFFLLILNKIGRIRIPDCFLLLSWTLLERFCLIYCSSGNILQDRKRGKICNRNIDRNLNMQLFPYSTKEMYFIFMFLLKSSLDFLSVKRLSAGQDIRGNLEIVIFWTSSKIILKEVLIHLCM